MSNPVVWFEVLGNDGEALRRFYGGLFGWTFDVEAPTGYGVVAPKDGRGIPGGVAAAPPGAGPRVTFYVACADVAQSLARAVALGGKAVMPVEAIPNGKRIAAFADPEGHVIGLVSESAAA
jgi:hypothetical protein